MENTIIYLLGFPGTGKLTIAKEICKQANVKLVDNHLINNPVFSLIETDGVTPLPRTVWDATAKIRDIVFDTMTNLSPPHYNFVLTNALSTKDPDDVPIYKKTKTMADERGALFIPVRLICDEEENMKRVVSPDRKLNMKEISPEGLKNARHDCEVFYSKHPNELTLDVTSLAAEKAAKAILDHAASISA